MLFVYETTRLLLKVNTPDKAGQVLDFYLRDKELFEQFEPDRMVNFYTRKFQKQALTFEYNMAMQGTLFRFYVYEKQNPDRIIGTISFHHITHGYTSSCEIGYKFSSEVHRRGYATEALTLVTDEIFRDLKLHRITAWALPDNLPSIRLLEKVGFVYEGTCREYMLLHGQWRDHVQYAMIMPKSHQAGS
jgi:ribosomal-protein-alanine N-acetyltransferase